MKELKCLIQAINNVVYGGSLVTTVHHTTPYVVDTTAPLLEVAMVDPYDSVTNTLTVHYMARSVFVLPYMVYI